ncbi:MAG: glutathione S-transferase [Paracoccaceae bacterium]|jgi:glutathione S-transferase
MPFTLFLQDRMLSSWSLRGHLLMEIAGLPYAAHFVPGGDPNFADKMLALASPARSVPALAGDDGLIVWDSLALAETVAELAPGAAVWPADSVARAWARSLAAEMHSGFTALRGACAMNLSLRYDGFAPSSAVAADVARIEALWSMTRARFGAGGPWLFGADFCAADAFFAPVAARFITYRLGVEADAAAYCAAVVRHPAFRRWRAMAVAEGPVSTRYDLPLAKGDWPGPAALPARALAEGEATPADAINAACPYSGKPPVAEGLAEIDGKVIGFCNPFCRDKSVADPQAWPKLAPLLA